MDINGTFINVVEIDVWCNCGRQYTVFAKDKDTWQETCPECGEKIELTFIFRVVEMGETPTK